MSEVQDTKFTPRPYQVVIAKKAMKENTIIFLPTGSGKTFISLLAMKRFLSQENRSFEEGGKNCIFVVNAVVLVEQQARVLERHLPISKAGRYSGQLNVDSWNRGKWQEEFKKHKVLVMTAEILHIILTHCFISPSCLSIIVFDECHAAVGRNPISLAMGLLPKNGVPRIIGMTATLLNGNAENTTKARHDVENLLQTFDARIAYVMDQDVKCFSTKPREEIIGFEEDTEPSDELKTAVQLLKRGEQKISSVFVIDQANDPLAKDIKKLNTKIVKYIADTSYQLVNIGMYGGSKAALYGIQLLEFRKICEKLFSFNVQITYAINTLCSVRACLEHHMSSLPVETVPYSCSNNKVKTLINLIREQKDEKGLDNFHCLVLVERKMTAKILCTVLKQVANIPEFSFIMPVYIVGGTGSSDPFPYNNDEIAKMSKTAIESFRKRDANVLISTDVMEEGIDVPFCNCVIKFDRVVSYKSYIQSKGRARSQDSNYFILVKKGEEQETRDCLLLYNEVQDYLWSVVRDPSINEQFQINFESSTSEANDVRYETKTGAVMRGTSAISILNKYCSLLRYDQYTDCSLEWEEDQTGKEKSQVCVAKLSLPEVAPVQLTVESDAMSNMKLAKQNAAFKICVELHKVGELDDDLVPVAPRRKFEADPRWWSHWRIADDIVADTVGKIGTSKRQSLYLYRVASCVQDCRPTSDKSCYLHVITIKPKNHDPPADRKYAVIYEELKKKPSFAILSSKKMPQICAFPVFLPVADVSVEIDPNYKEINFTEDQICKLHNFNESFFKEMTKCSTAAADSDGGGKDYFVVPTKTDQSDVSIDWEAVNRIEELEDDKPPKSKRRKLNVSSETYHGTVVKPWYRECGKQVYMVTKVCTDSSGHSMFPGEFKSYVDWFTSVYDLTVLHPELPLLEVKAFSLRVNCLLKRRDARHRLSTSQHHFLPELCTQLPMSGTLWIKASMMPSILYRLERILIAEEFRATLASQSKLGKTELIRGLEWKPLQEEEVLEKKIAEKEIENATNDCDTPKEYPLFQNIEEQDVNYLQGYYNFLSFKPSIVLEDDRNEYETVPKVDVPRQALLQSCGGEQGLELRNVFSALTAPSANDLVNYERLETLGDSFLKVAVSLFLYETCPLKNEGLLSDLKCRFLGNRNLFCCALNKRLPELMCVSNTVQSTGWHPPCFPSPHNEVLASGGLENGRGEEGEQGQKEVVTFSDSSKPKLVPLDDIIETDGKHFFGSQSIKDKTIADCVEALIGASLMDCGWEGAFDFLIWLEVLPETVERPNKTSMPLKRLLENGFKESSFFSSKSDMLPAEVKNIQELIGYNFKNPEILKQALTHPSYDPKNSYERLEFIGDSVLDFLITTYIYENCGLLTPGQLTDLRSALVNNITFAALTVKYGLNRFMLANSPKLLQVVDFFIKGRKASNHTIDNDVLVLCEEGEISISEAITVPKALADVFEALAGAIFFDSGRDLNAVWNVFYPLMHDVIPDELLQEESSLMFHAKQNSHRGLSSRFSRTSSYFRPFVSEAEQKLWFGNSIKSFCNNVPIEPVRELHETFPGVKFEYNHDDKHSRMVATCRVELKGKLRKFHGYGENKKMAKRAAAKFALYTLKKGLEAR